MSDDPIDRDDIFPMPPRGVRAWWFAIRAWWRLCRPRILWVHACYLCKKRRSVPADGLICDDCFEAERWSDYNAIAADNARDIPRHS